MFESTLSKNKKLKTNIKKSIFCELCSQNHSRKYGKNPAFSFVKLLQDKGELTNCLQFVNSQERFTANHITILDNIKLKKLVIYV